MNTPIKSTLALRPPDLWITTIVGGFAVAVDLLMTAHWRPPCDARYLWYGLPAAAAAIFAALALRSRNAAITGWRSAPVQGWKYWAKAGVVLLTLVVAAGVICGAVLLGWLRYRLPPQYFYLSDASQIGPLLVHMCIVAPLREETIYRLALCIPMAAWAGPRAAIVVSGVLFAAMHVLNGNPAPENLIGGFLLAWAFLRSETILVPLALHSVGNMLAWLCQTVIFLWMR